MSIQATTVFCASCNAPGCTMLSSDYENGNNAVYDNVAALLRQFHDTVENTLADNHGWLLVREHQAGAPGGFVEKHYCGKHTTWDDDFDKRIPALGGNDDVPDVEAQTVISDPANKPLES
jgi:hypothetical protein